VLIFQRGKKGTLRERERKEKDIEEGEAGMFCFRPAVVFVCLSVIFFLFVFCVLISFWFFGHLP
jgi:hypothetical protein